MEAAATVGVLAEQVAVEQPAKTPPRTPDVGADQGGRSEGVPVRPRV
jgi:hypothetical protein